MTSINRAVRAMIIAILMTTTVFAVMATVPMNVSGGGAHASITITSDSDFSGGSANTTYGVTWGSGTASDPYIISGWDIMGSGGDAIYISSTTVHFVIKNCNVSGATWWSGIYLQNNDHANVSNCNLTGNYYGIYASDSDLIAFNNSITGGYIGIDLEDGTNAVLRENNLSGQNNYGIYSYSADTVDIRGNEISNPGSYGIYTQDVDILDVVDNEIQNTYCGIYGYFLTGVCAILGNQISDCSWAGIYLYQSSNVRIFGNNMTNSGQTPFLDYCTGTQVFHNNIDESQAYTESCVNQVWDDGYPSGGNYWVTASHTDAMSGVNQDIPGSDGICDTPVSFYDSSTDRYPLATWFTGNANPSAAFTVNERILNTTTALVMNASLSADAEDEIDSLQFRWDFEGDLVWDTGFSSTTTQSHTYAVEGSYSPRVEVQDSGGLLSDYSLDIIVSDNAHDTIHIDFDSGFTGPNSTTGISWGSGTVDDPYIISGWVIDATDEEGIYIYDTTAYFIIRDCQVYFGGNQYSGIVLYMADNGLVDNCTAMKDNFGIEVYYSDNIDIMNCTVSEILNRALYSYQSTNVQMTGNNVSFSNEGIHILRSANLLISNNTVSNCSRGIYPNTSTNVTMLLNNLTFNGYGIWATWSEQLNMVRNEFYQNLYTGASINNVKDANIVGNNFTGPSNGGLQIQSSMNILAHHNNFINLGWFATDQASSTWDHGYPSGGNYWDTYTSPDSFSGPNQDVPGADGIVDAPYVIDSDSQDNYPLTAPFDMSNLPPIAVITSSDRILNTSTALYVHASASFDVEDPLSSLEVRWDWEGDGTWDTVWTTTKNSSHTYSAEGKYMLTLNVRDTAGLNSTTRTMVIVSDSYRPTNIHINGNSEFDAAHGVNGGGDGSAGNPYVIQDYVLDATYSHGIWIENTDAHFLIRNVQIYYGYANTLYGVYLYYVQNGSIESSFSYENYHGIYAYYSGNLSVSNCDFENNQMSVRLYQTDYVAMDGLSSSNSTDNSMNFWYSCDYISVTNCQINNTDDSAISLGGSNPHDILIANNVMSSVSYGVYAEYVTYLTVEDNNITATNYGIWISYSKDCKISRNEIFGPSYGAYLYDVDDSSIDHCYFNATDSYAMYLDYADYVMIDNCHFDGNNMGIWIRNANYAMVSNSTATGVTWGVRIQDSNYVSIRQNNFSGTLTYGVYVSANVDYFEIVGNNLSYAPYGFNVQNSNYMNITENAMFGNTNFGGYVQASSNGHITNNIFASAPWGLYMAGCSWYMIAGNNFLGNTNQASDDGSSNTWNETALYGGGNYWSNYTYPDLNMDGFGDTPAMIDVDSIDYLPLMAPWIPNQPPKASFNVTPLTGILSTSFSFNASDSWDVEDDNASLPLQYRWDWTNDGTYDTSWSTTATASHIYTTPGTKTIKLEIQDSGGLTGTTTKTVTVSEVAPVSTSSLTGTTGTNGWYTSNVLLNLTATDDYSGVDVIRYVIGSGSWVNYTGNVTMSSEGIFVVTFSGVDNALLEEANKTVTVKIDKTVPTLTINQSNGMSLTKSYNIISWIGSDAISGIDHFEVKIGTGSFVSVGNAMSYNFTGLTNGTYNVTVKAIDNAGNEYNASIQFTVSLPGAGGGISGDLVTYMLIIVVIIVGVIVMVMVMRRGKKPAAIEQMKPEPPTPPTA